MAAPDPPPSSPATEGRVVALIGAVKGLTFANVGVIVLLVIVAIPAYVTWRAVNDPALLDRFFSHYREISSPHSSCTLRELRIRGGHDSWGISTGFAYQGDTRWMISVALPHEPTTVEIESYCEALNLIIDYMRDPDPQAALPDFPNTDDPIIRKYQP